MKLLAALLRGISGILRSRQPYEAYATKGSLAFISASSCGAFGVCRIKNADEINPGTRHGLFDVVHNVGEMAIANGIIPPCQQVTVEEVRCSNS